MNCKYLIKNSGIRWKKPKIEMRRINWWVHIKTPSLNYTFISRHLRLFLLVSLARSIGPKCCSSSFMVSSHSFFKAKSWSPTWARLGNISRCIGLRSLKALDLQVTWNIAKIFTLELCVLFCFICYQGGGRDPITMRTCCSSVKTWPKSIYNPKVYLQNSISLMVA